MAKKILIVDDDPDFVEASRMILERAGYDVISAPDGDQGLSRVKEEKPDLIILDIIMKTALDGLHMSRRMAESADRDIPILMVTSIANTDYASLFPTDEYIPINDFVSKPIAPHTLLEKTADLLGEPA